MENIRYNVRECFWAALYRFALRRDAAAYRAQQRVSALANRIAGRHFGY